MADLYNKAQYIYIAGANKSGSLYGIVPVPGTSNVTLSSGSTTRAASGSRTNSNGILENIAPHILRVDYSDLVSCPSYKFEPQRTNFLWDTDYLVSSSAASQEWTPIGAFWSFVSESTSPLGTGFSAFLRESSSLAIAGYSLRQTIPTFASTNRNFTVSVYAKRSGSGADVRNLMIQHGGVGSVETTMNTYFILEGTGSIVPPVAKAFVSGAYIESLPNGWYRCSVVGSSANVTPYARYFVTSGSSTAVNYTPNGRSGLYLVAAQFESGSNHGPITSPSTYSGSMVTSYISSSRVATTRAADNAVILPGPSNPTDFCTFMTYKCGGNALSGSTNYIMALNAQGGNPYFGVYQNGDSIVALSSSFGFVSFTPSTLPSLATNIEHKIAVRYSANELTYFVNGVKITSGSAPNFTWGTNSFLTLGGENGSGTTLTQAGSFYVRVAALFNQGLSDAECISLTTTGSGVSII